jgi:UDP-N-acetylglucosamine--N-acetylmuramyl-(pentapeptide) pyrophosphoryl-undecaprenol N-acetylglucosamine transferase
MKKKINLLFAAGGTGGHLFPATAVAQYLKSKYEDRINCIFIGTEKRIESIKVPKLGFDYHSMPITAFPGKNINGLKYPITFIKSISAARRVIKKNDIDAVICTGAYISYPPGLAANRLKRKLFLMESNVNPGKSILWLANNASRIYTSYAESSKFFDPSVINNIKCLGNPVRSDILNLPDKNAAYEKFGSDSNKKTIFIFGGSLGAQSINRFIEKNLQELDLLDVNVIWQTGKNYVFPASLPSNVHITEFIDDMGEAYSISDLIIARSGATTVAELSVLGKPSILVPLPSAANNEQYENAKMLDESGAAILLKDSDIDTELMKHLKSIIHNPERLKEMTEKVKNFSKPDAVMDIADDIIRTIDPTFV